MHNENNKNLYWKPPFKHNFSVRRQFAKDIKYRSHEVKSLRENIPTIYRTRILTLLTPSF